MRYDRSLVQMVGKSPASIWPPLPLQGVAALTVTSIRNQTSKANLHCGALGRGTTGPMLRFAIDPMRLRCMTYLPTEAKFQREEDEKLIERAENA